MIRSLKYVETQLSKKNTIVGTRSEDEDSKKGKKKKFHQFLKSALKIRFEHQEVEKAESVDEISENFEKCLFQK